MGVELDRLEGFEQDCACPRPVAVKVFEQGVVVKDKTCDKPVTQKMIGGVMVKVSIS